MGAEQPSPIARLRAAAAEQGAVAPMRPVEAWNPSHCGHSGMVIEASGRWLHEGRPIARPELVRLFASILRREPDGSFVLVTPGEKLTIEVEDAPFVAVEMAAEGEGAGQRLAFRVNTGEVVIAGPDHPLTLRDGRPYLAVRRGLEARIDRAVWVELAELALAGSGAVRSDGATFRLD
jgi:hypothetical protein